MTASYHSLMGNKSQLAKSARTKKQETLVKLPSQKSSTDRSQTSINDQADYNEIDEEFKPPEDLTANNVKLEVIYEERVIFQREELNISSIVSTFYY